MARAPVVFSPELQFLLDGLSFDAARVPAEAPEGLDWERVLHLLHEHRLVPRLGPWLLELPGVPATDRGTVQDRLRSVAVHSMRMAAEIERLRRRLEGEDIQSRIVKGPVLSQRLYGSLTARHFQDLDVLVPRERALDAMELLEQDGFRPLHAIPPGYEEKVLASSCEGRHIHPDGRMVEIHWALFRPGWGQDVLTAAAWQGVEGVDLDGHTVAAPSWEVQVAFLALHGHKHHWMRLQWLVDVAEAVHQDPRLVGRLEDRLPGWRHALATTWLSCDQLLGTDFRSLSGLPQSGLAQRLYATICTGLAKDRGDGLGPLRRHRYFVASLDRRRDRVSYFFRRARPEWSDWAWLRLPRWLSWLHYVLRPLRIALHGAPARREPPD